MTLLLVMTVIFPLFCGSNAQLLNCNFDDNTTCNWVNALNGLEDDFDWKIGNNLMVDGWHSIPRTLTGTGNFAYVQGQFRPSESEAARAWLRSPVIDGLGSQTVLSFNYWKTAAPPTLQVCTRDAGESILKCFETISGIGPQAWSKRSVVIPPNPLPYQIIIAASGFRTALDTLAIDDLTYSQVIRKNEAPLKGVSRVKNSEKQFDSRQYSPSHLGTSGFRPNNLGAGSGGFPQTNRVDSGPKQFLPEHSAFSSFNSGFGNNFLNNSLGATIPPHQQNIRSETNPLANGVANFNGNIQSNFDRFGTSNINANGVVNTDLGRNNFNQNFGEISPTVIRKFFTDSPPQISQFPAKSSQQFPINSAVNSAQFVSGSNQLSQFGLNDFRQQQNSQSKDICTPVECNFESDMCEWFNDFKSTTEWKLRNPSTPGFGIPTDQTGRTSYAYVTGDNQKNDQRAFLGSGLFVIPFGAFLQFTAYISDPNTGRLSLYRNDAQNPNNIIWQTHGSRGLGPGWQLVRAPLKGSNIPVSVIFIADSLPGNQYIGIDDIRLVDGNDHAISCVGQFEHARLESNGKPFIEDLGEPKNSFGNFEASQLQSRLFTPSESSLFPSPPVFAPVQFEPQEESSNFGYQPLASIDDEVSHLTGVENSTHLGSAAPDQQLLDFPPPPVSRTDPFLAALNGLITPVQPGPSVPQSQERNFANSIFPQQQQQQQQMDQFWGNLMKILIGKKKRKKK